MEPQAERLPEWVAHYLDDLKASLAFDPISYYTLMLYGDRALLSEAVVRIHRYDLATESRNYTLLRQQLFQTCIDHADELWPRVPLAVKRGLIRSSVLDAALHVREAAQMLACWAMTDACEGGCAQPFHRPPRPGIWGSWMPGKRAARRLRSPRFIRRYVWAQGDVAARRTVLKRMAGLIIGQECGGAADEEAFYALIEGQQPSTIPQPDYRAGLLRMLAATHGIKVRKLTARELRRRRRTTARAALFAASLIGARAVGAFARGEVVTLRGPELTFGVRRAQSIHHVGHGALELGVKATDGPALGTACFFIEKTPCLDQLGAIALHTESGTEREILAIANMITVRPEGADHPLIVHRGRAEAERTRARLQNVNRAYQPRGRLYRWDHQPEAIRVAREEAYWTATGAIWENALATALLGSGFSAGWLKVRPTP